MKAAPLPSLLFCALLGLGAVQAGPYSAGFDDPAKVDAPIPGFIGPDGEGKARLATGPTTVINEHNFVNPLFFAWADAVASYAPAPGVAGVWMNASFTLGPVTGDNFDVASLGDLNADQIAAGVPPGSITVQFAQPIHDLTGADFSVFENAFIAGPGSTGVGPGGVLAELAYVEVSADGVNFVRFPSASLTASPTGAYGTIAPTDVRNLAGKHLNAFGDSWGTPFDLAEVGLASISYVRLVDIPGSGTFLDSAGHSIFDSWLTIGSGGADLEAVGAISHLTTFDEWQDLRGLTGPDRGPDADPDFDGLSNLLEYAFARLPDRGESAPAISFEVVAGHPAIVFVRDERATDLIYEVQARNNLATGQWTTLARSTGGQPFVGADGFTPAITEMSASAMASVGVVRKVRVADVQPIAGYARRFLRVTVTAASLP